MRRITETRGRRTIVVYDPESKSFVARVIDDLPWSPGDEPAGEVEEQVRFAA